MLVHRLASFHKFLWLYKPGYCGFALSLVFLSAIPVWGSAPTSVTTLAISGNNEPVTAVAWGAVVTLSAAVTVGGLPVTTGQVTFEERQYKTDGDLQVLGIAQLTGTGTAVMRFVPGIGAHHYTATFLGTPNGATPAETSASPSVTLTVTGKFPTALSLTASGSTGDYSMEMTLVGYVNELGKTAPANVVSISDTTNNGQMLASVQPGAAKEELSMQSAALVVGNAPAGLAIADFNNDGFTDLAVSNEDDNTITVLLGNGDGTFRQPTGSPISVGNSPWGVASSDFNGDGIADLAIADFRDDTVTILLATGDGTFLQARNSPIPVGHEPSAITSADLDRDGIADLIVTNGDAALPGGDGSLNILLGNGDGTFGQAPNSPITTVAGAPLQAMFTAVGDFNGDRVPDLAVTTEFGLLAIFLGNGDGTFTVPYAPLNIGGWPLAEAAAVGDFNRDGNADLAVADDGCCSGQIGGDIRILTGDGTGHFVRNQYLYANHAIYSLAVGDFNGDGRLDLAHSSGGGPIPNSVVLGNGDGTFAVTSVILPAWLTTIVAADLNGDGVSDLAGVSLWNSASQRDNRIYIMLSQMTETETGTATGIAPAGAGVHSVVASFPGDESFGPSVSRPVQLTGSAKMVATVTVTPSSASVSTAQTLNVTVNVTSASGNPTPSGTVTLTAGSFTSQAALAAGVVSIDIPAGKLASGRVPLDAAYSGDANYQPAVGASAVLVTDPPPPGFSISGTPVTIPHGATSANTATITVTPTGGFSGNVSLTAVITEKPQGAQSPPTLSFGSTNPVNITTGMATGTLTITTIAGKTTSFINHRNAGPFFSGLLCVLLWIPFRRSKRSPVLTLLLLILLAVAGEVGCSSHHASEGNAGTTAGNYTITITGTSGALVATANVSLVVQ